MRAALDDSVLPPGGVRQRRVLLPEPIREMEFNAPLRGLPFSSKQAHSARYLLRAREQHGATTESSGERRRLDHPPLFSSIYALSKVQAVTSETCRCQVRPFSSTDPSNHGKGHAALCTSYLLLYLPSP